MTTRILVVPGFIVDTYSEIEKSYIELTEVRDPMLTYIWLVPSIRSRYNRYKNPANPPRLTEPLYVTELKRRNIPFIEGSVSKYNPITNFFLFRRVFKATGTCAVYTHFGFERFWAAFYGKVFGKTTIWNEHWHSMGTRYVRAKRWFYRFFVDYFISVSRFVGQALPPGSRVITILNAIEPGPRLSLSPDERRGVRRRLKLRDSGPMVLMVAAFRPEKRHSIALELCRRIVATNPDALFAFLGDGPGRDAFIEQVRELQLEANVVTPGHVPPEDYYRAADVCMLTSINEALPYCVLEAMKYSKPVVTFGTGGPLEIIDHGETGVLVAEGDVDTFSTELRQLIDDADAREAMGDKAYDAIVQRFSRERWKQQIRKAMLEICGADRAPTIGSHCANPE